MTDIETPHEHWESTPENQTVLRELQESALSQLNFGSSVPLGQRQAELIGRRTPQRRVAFAEVMRDFREGRWSEGLSGAFHMIFGKSRVVEGLGMYVNSVDSLPLRERMGILTQIEQNLAPTGERNVEDALKRSAIQYETELSLLRRGYARDRMAIRSRHIVVQAGQNLSSLVAPNILRQIRGENGNEPEILGTLNTDMPLPTGSYLYLDRDGFPLLVSRTLFPPGRFPPVPLFRRRPESQMREGLTREEAAIEFMDRNLRPGDILLVSKGGARQDAAHKLFQGFAQFFSSRPGEGVIFHASHTMVVDSTKRIRHITQRGQYASTIRETFAEHAYNGVSVARVNDASKIGAFVSRMENTSSRARSFNTAGLAREGLHLLRQRMAQGQTRQTVREADTTSTDQACICADYVTDAAAGLLPDLAAARNPRDIAASSDVRLVYSMDLGRI